MQSIKRALLQLFSCKDNETLDLGRILWAFVTSVFCGCSVYSIYMGQAFDPAVWGVGAGAVLASGGGALAMKKSTEPEGKAESKDT